MGIFNSTIASGITDRIAAIVAAVDTDLIAARTAAAPGGLFNRVSASQVYEVERDFITPCFNFEQYLSGATILAGAATVIATINSLDSHCSQTASVSFDKFLQNSGLQVSEHFAKLYGAVKGTQLTAHNVFSETPIVLGSLSKAGTWTYSAGTDLGAGGTTKYSIDPSITGEQVIRATLPSTVITTNCTMNVSGLDDAGHVQWDSVTFSNNVSGATADTTLKYRTVTAVNVVTDAGIPNGSTVSLTNKKERVVTY